MSQGPASSLPPHSSVHQWVVLPANQLWNAWKFSSPLMGELVDPCIKHACEGKKGRLLGERGKKGEGD